VRRAGLFVPRAFHLGLVWVALGPKRGRATPVQSKGEKQLKFALVVVSYVTFSVLGVQQLLYSIFQFQPPMLGNFTLLKTLSKQTNLACCFAESAPWRCYPALFPLFIPTNGDGGIIFQLS
jgi:hypothetical protein